METWKKSMGIDGKVFIIKGKYPDLRKLCYSVAGFKILIKIELL